VTVNQHEHIHASTNTSPSEATTHKETVVKEEITPKQLRSFGLMVGGIFAAIAVWPLMIRDEEARWWALIFAAFLILPAAVFPAALAWPYKGWMWIGYVVGWINTRIILGFIFYFIVTPIGIFRRWIGKDPMGRKLRADFDSYRILRKPRPASHLKQQY
jgi:hypothetical protein